VSTPLELGNRAWEPYKTVDTLEVLDRHNGIPTLGFFTAAGQRQLFWQAIGYVTDDFSVWIYVPVSPAAPADPRLPEGLILDSPIDRIVTVGMAHHNRLIFEREWNVPARANEGRVLHDVTHFLVEAMDVADRHGLPPGRSELLDQAAQVVRELEQTSS
jgi:hypothetical protein